MLPPLHCVNQDLSFFIVYFLFFEKEGGGGARWHVIGKLPAELGKAGSLPMTSQKQMAVRDRGGGGWAEKKLIQQQDNVGSTGDEYLKYARPATR